MRYSRQRECILSYLRSVKTHPTAEAVYNAVRLVLPNISLGTVYRNLKQLEAEGDIITIPSALDRLNYDGFTHPHQHFICTVCESIIDMDMKSHISEAEKCGFKVERENTVLYGTCANCAEKAKNI